MWLLVCVATMGSSGSLFAQAVSGQAAAQPTEKEAAKQPGEKPVAGTQPKDRAPDEAKPPVQQEVVADELSVQLLDGLHKVEYVTGPSLRKLVASGSFSATMPMAAPVQGRFCYDWDGVEGELHFDEPSLQVKMRQAGFDHGSLDTLFEFDNWRETFRACTLTAAKDGENTKVTIAGQARDGMKSMTFNNSTGLVTTFELKPPQAPQPFVGTVEWIAAGDRWLKSTTVMKMSIGEMGSMTVSFAFEYQEVGGFHVWKKIQQGMQMGQTDLGSLLVEFESVQVNDDAKSGPATADPTSQPKSPVGQ